MRQAASWFPEAAVAGLIAELHGREDASEPSARILEATRRLDEFLLDLSSAGWRERVTLIREHLCPDAEYMRHTSGAWLPVAYARRAGHGARKWLVAIPTLRTAEPVVPPGDCPEASTSAASVRTSQ